jgi:peptidoglycan/LPS O-acetylase OafA/YrhL
MSELNLLLFGCAVSFIAAAGAYTYVRERYTARAPRRELPVLATRRPEEAA